MEDSSNEEKKQTDTSSDVEEEAETAESQVDIVVITLDQEDEPREAEAAEDQNQTATSSNGEKDPKAAESRVDKVVITLDKEEEPRATEKQMNIISLRSKRKEKAKALRAASAKAKQDQIDAVARHNIWACDTSAELEEEGNKKTIHLIYTHLRDQHLCRFTCDRTRVHISFGRE